MPHADKASIPADYVRKQTIKNAERYITDELKKYEEQVAGRPRKSAGAGVPPVRAGAGARRQSTSAACRSLAQVLAVVRLPFVAGVSGRGRTVISARKSPTAKNWSSSRANTPCWRETLGAEFVPNDVNLADDGKDLAIITGPNMAGKSTYIRQAALLVLLAQTGSFIPAKEAQIGVADRIFTRVGASDELTRGQSTFMVEMTETANILNNATDRSLVILDEVGRGTSTYDGLSLAWAITEHLANAVKCRTLFATHYHELTELGQLLVNVKNLNVAVREWAGDVVFLHKIIPGGTDKSYGIHVAKLAGIPKVDPDPQ